MSQKIIEKDGMKFRTLTKLKPTAAKEYQEAMLNRVEYFAKKNAKESIFNNFMENTIVKGLSTILNLKVKVDEMLGDNRDKVQEVIEKILLFGL
ncbi:MAG: hypothetical protein ACTSR8_02870 [Promethearchaeota archaeon]